MGVYVRGGPLSVEVCRRVGLLSVRVCGREGLLSMGGEVCCLWESLGGRAAVCGSLWEGGLLSVGVYGWRGLL